MSNESPKLVHGDQEDRYGIVSAISGSIIVVVFLAWIGSYLFLRQNALKAGQILPSTSAVATLYSNPGPTLLIAVDNDFKEFIYKPIAWSESFLSKRNVAVVNMDRIFGKP